MNIAALRAAFKASLDQVAGLKVYEKAVDAISPPCAMVIIPTNSEFFNPYHAMGKGLASWKFIVRVLAGRADVKAGQDALDAYLSMGSDATSSVLNALTVDPSFGGLVDTSKIDGVVNGYGLFTIANVDYLGFDVPVIVYAGRK